MRILLFLALLLLITGIANGTEDEYSQYFLKNVTVNACNTTVYQGLMVGWWPESITIREMCNPDLGDVTIRKSCIIWIHPGYEC